MTAKFDPADHRQRGSIAGVQDPSLARAHVSGSLSLGLENGPRGRTSGVGEEPSGHAYRWPPLSQLREQELSVAYTAITGRRAFRGPMRLLIVAARLHGPDTVDLLRELYQDGGARIYSNGSSPTRPDWLRTRLHIRVRCRRVACQSAREPTALRRGARSPPAGSHRRCRRSGLSSRGRPSARKLAVLGRSRLRPRSGPASRRIGVLRDVSPMSTSVTAATCIACGEPLQFGSRADRRTCSTRCRVAAWRASGQANPSRVEHVPTPGSNGMTAAVEAVTSVSDAREGLALPSTPSPSAHAIARSMATSVPWPPASLRSGCSSQSGSARTGG